MESLILFILSSVAVALCSALAHPALRGAVRGALGLILLLTLIMPFTDGVGKLLSGEIKLPEYSDGSGTEFEKITLAAFEEGITASLIERYGTALAGVRVRVRGFDPSEMRADGITVILPEGAESLDYREMRDYLDKNFTRGGGSEVFYE